MEREDENRRALVIIQNVIPSHIHNLFILFIFFSDAKARVRALRLPLQALIGWRGCEGRAEGEVKVLAVVQIVEIILIGEVGRAGVSSS